MTSTTLFTAQHADLAILAGQTVAVIGYGNQGRAQALNLRDSGIDVIIGNRGDDYRERAANDGFVALPIADACKRADIAFLLIPDEVLPKVFGSDIAPHMREGAALVLASGYAVAFDEIEIADNIDVLLIAPRMIGVGVRERYLTKEGFYCLVGVHHDATSTAQARMLALTAGLGGLQKPAIEVTCKQEAVLDLFNEQAFGPAFGHVLLTATRVLLDHGLPPEAVLVEMYMSEEMSYTYRKMADIGLIKQTHFHSKTAQYGAMSRALRFLGMGLRDKMERVYKDIDSGAFAREWQGSFARIKFKVIKFFALRQRINRVEQRVRKNLGLEDWSIDDVDTEAAKVLADPKVREQLAEFERAFEY